MPAGPGHRRGDAHHLLVGQRAQQRVGHPVDRVALAEGDHAQLAAVEIQGIGATVDGAVAVRAGQDRRVEPVHALDAVVLARLAQLDHHAVGAVLAAVEVAQAVRPRRVHVLAAHGQVLRVVDRERRALGRRDGLVLAHLRGPLEPLRRRGLAVAAAGALLGRLLLRPLRALAGQELRDRLVELGLVVAQVGVLRVGRDDGRERHLAHRVPGREGHQLEQVQDRVVVVQALVGLRVAADELGQLVALVEDLLGADLRLGLAQEVLLPRRAHEVGVGVAEAHVVERVLAAQPLVAGLDVDRRVARARRVVVAVVDVGVDAAHVVDRAPEPAEVDVDDVVDLERVARGREQRLDRLQRQVGPAVRVGGVDLVRPRAGDVDPQVARDRHHRRRLVVGVEVDEQDRVRVGLVARLVGHAVVGPEDHDRLRPAHVVARELVLAEADRALLRGALVEVVDELADLEEDRRRDRDRGQGDDDRAPDQEALVHPAGWARRLLACRRAHGRTPSMVSSDAASRGVAASRAAAIDSGRSRTKSPSARR